MQSVSKSRWRPHKHRPSHGLLPEHSWCTNYLRKIKILEQPLSLMKLVCLYFNFLSIFQHICRRCHFRCRAVKQSLFGNYPLSCNNPCDTGPRFNRLHAKGRLFLNCLLWKARFIKKAFQHEFLTQTCTLVSNSLNFFCFWNPQSSYR